MFRFVFAGVSALALMTTAAVAEKEQKTTPMKTVAAEKEKSSPLVQPAKKINASLVKTRNDAKELAEIEFAEADINVDGKISKTEFIAYATLKHTPAINDETKAATAPTHAAAEKKPMNSAEAAESTKTTEEQFADLSKNDEEITKEELVASHIADFDTADANDDDLLDDKERQAFASLVAVAAPKTNS